MAKITSRQLFEVVSKDDVNQFEQILSEKKTAISYRLGRFPILSICYLYGSKKILKKYQEQLLEITEYTKQDEPLELSTKFRKVAGRALRLFVDSDMVLPVEMLAITHQDKILKKIYFSCEQNENTEQNLKTIYQINGQTFEVFMDMVMISKPKITTKEKRLFKAAFAICLVFISLFSGMWTTAAVLFGDGVTTISQIYSVEQLESAMKNPNNNYEIKSDLEIVGDFEISKFSGKINGNGKKITVKNNTKSALFKNFSGEIKNLNIVYDYSGVTLSGGHSTICLNNDGTIENVNVVIMSPENFKKVDDQYGYLAGICVNNKNKIENCQVSINAEIKTSGNGEAFVCGIAGENFGQIKNCVVNKESTISATEVDIAGIVGTNNIGGSVSNCKNYANLNQSCDIAEWSPMVAGIVGINYGTIYQGFNFGDLKITDTDDTKKSTHIVCSGGVSAINYNKIDKSLNFGDVTCESNTKPIYVGGIAGESSTIIQDLNIDINECGSEGEISVKSVGETAYCFSGGIAGLFQGALNNSYSAMTFKTPAESGRYFQGGILGVSVAFSTGFPPVTEIVSVSFTSAENNYCLNSDNAEHTMGGFVDQFDLIYFNNGLKYNGFKILYTKEDLVKSGVYWYEQ